MVAGKKVAATQTKREQSVDWRPASQTAGNPVVRRARRIGTGVVGMVVVVVGLILIPYPGPGILITLGGLAILSTEFQWAGGTLVWARHKYDAWEAWMKRQTPGVQLCFSLATLAVTVLTLWLLDCYGMMSDWLHLGWDWAQSPLPIFSK